MSEDSRPVFELSNPPGLYDPSNNGYSHVAVVPAATKLLFIAGQGGEYTDGQLPAHFCEQARQALSNFETALRAQGSNLQQVFKITLLIVDHDEHHLGEWVNEANKVWQKGAHPVCTLIPVPRLALDGMLVEIEAVAACY
ncbi:RidA family protein [Pseudomonas cremoricolorata]|uniref:Endoribonuclease L-PSP n=1 Tax=Pseudomonas cremoricolorata TaxID=157783 RepID=A0A089YFX1_9PSED|nr:RidA family protein [Pseudomonas cremoricolorata]AIR90608.1 endoribonuclease L-PSP [Pseudomonas cremoricolorata]